MLKQDLLYAIRVWSKKPAVTAWAVLSLALGIGANTAIFSVINSVILRPLPYQDSDRLVELWEESPERGWLKNTVAAANYLDWKEQSTAFAGMAAYREGPMSVILTGDGEPERLQVGLTTANYFRVLGAGAAVGRTFLPEEDWSGERVVVVLSHRLWERRFGSRPDIVGKSILLNGISATVVGVASSDFHNLTEDVDLWTTFAWNAADIRQAVWARRAHNLRVVARLKDGVSTDQAKAELAAIAGRLAEAYPETNEGMSAGLTPLREWVMGEVRRPLLVLLGAVALVLLITCANMANLLLARASSRFLEITIRSALGAGRGRLVRQLLTESCLLSSLGGIAGLLFGFWGLRALVALGMDAIPRSTEIVLDARVLLFTLAVTLLTGILFGLAPALGAAAVDMNSVLKDGGGRSTESRSSRLRSLLVVSEFALAVFLVVGAGLFLKSFGRLLSTDPGFEVENLLTAKILLPAGTYADDTKVAAFYEQLMPQLAGLPGVRHAAAVSSLPLTVDYWTSDFVVSGRPPSEEVAEVRHNAVTPDYFRTLGILLVAGRLFTGADHAQAPPSVIINETMARRYFPDENPIGKRISFDNPPNGESVWWTIVGVVRDQKQENLAQAVEPEVYKTAVQWPRNPMNLMIRTSADPLSLAASVCREVQTIDPNLPIFEVRTMEQVLSESVAQTRFLTVLLATFAGIALIQAAIGLYAVIGYSVSRRTQEIGIRMALGSRAVDVLRMVVGQGMTLVAVGLVLGLALALGLNRFLSSFLYDVSPFDLVTFVLVPTALVAVGLLACYLPARRAARVDPLVSLRKVE